jgi:hypothetical protein
METTVAKPWMSLDGCREVTTTSIMMAKMMMININYAYLPVLLRQQHLGTIIVGDIGFPCIVIRESLPLQGNGRDGRRATMTKIRTSIMVGGGQKGWEDVDNKPSLGQGGAREGTTTTTELQQHFS